ncbi:hypothetical protein TpMuguga_01g00109 [Theileria parva strain Muguga]|uniref:Uncharacterized protein n=1 Tax=Theileria parva TaxID=5875 RepID=Q4N9K5_THEPA|nr:uncharacterized protein TpMuguga_01g00109 [Theileria parva strain Muguga]EAN33353.1 hypothetical protein TpMuguga_01g00109 [Theileria parva strain Muguga]|eukprot:XP_765636.1 hypothetical protein [Theileria parva strain Muguga]
MDSDFKDVDVVSELNKLSSENNYKEIVNLLRENFYQFNDDPNKLIAILTIRIYYNLHLKVIFFFYTHLLYNFNEVDSDFDLIQSIFTDKLKSQFSYTKDSVCPFSTFLIHAYYPHMKGSSFQSLTRMCNLFHKLSDDLNSQRSYEKRDESESSKEREVIVKRIMKTVLLLSDVLITLLRPQEAIKLLKEVNLKYDKEDVSTNMILSLIYRKLGYTEESERYLKAILGKADERKLPYTGFLKMFSKDYKGASEEFKSVLSLDKKSLSPQESVLLNNLAVSTLYAGSSQEAKNLFFNFEILTHGFQAHRGIMSNADVLVELSIYE